MEKIVFIIGWAIVAFSAVIGVLLPKTKKGELIHRVKIVLFILTVVLAIMLVTGG